MTTSLADRIYRAQCIGNVEPIEYKVPYPSTQSLIEGQNIKFSDQVIYEKENITNLQFYELVQHKQLNLYLYCLLRNHTI